MGTVAIFLTIAGTIFCIVEFFAPGIGVFGLGGLTSLIVAFFLATTAFELAPFYIFSIQVVTILVVGLISYLTLKNSKFVNKIILNDVSKENEPTVDPSVIGKIGMTKTPLKPVGTITVDDKDIEVLSNDGYINSDECVIISEVVKNKIFVKKHNREV